MAHSIRLYITKLLNTEYSSSVIGHKAISNKGTITCSSIIQCITHYHWSVLYYVGLHFVCLDFNAIWLSTFSQKTTKIVHYKNNIKNKNNDNCWNTIYKVHLNCASACISLMENVSFFCHADVEVIKHTKECNHHSSV